MQDKEKALNEQAARKEYNHRYYLRNKQRILERKRKKSMSSSDRPYLTLVNGRAVLPTYFRTIAWGKVLFLLSLNLLMTYLLIKEAAPFYLEPSDGLLSGYFKAGLIEGIAILFSFPRGRTFFAKWSEKALVAACCLLSLWTISSRVIGESLQSSARQKYAESHVSMLEKESVEKSEFLKRLKDKGWITAARDYEKGIVRVQSELVAARNTLATMKVPKFEVMSLLMLLVFRILVFLSNLICAHLLVERIETLSWNRYSQR